MWKEKGTPTKASITPGLDEHSVFAEAQFVDPAKLDFRLKEGTPGIDKGVLIPGVSANFKGAAPDMGALEAGGENWVQKVLEKTKECGVTK